MVHPCLSIAICITWYHIEQSSESKIVWSEIKFTCTKSHCYLVNYTQFHMESTYQYRGPAVPPSHIVYSEYSAIMKWYVGSVSLQSLTTLVTPLLKKPSLDPQKLKNYRPVSNLSFVSKLVERVAARQLMDYLTAKNLMPKLQSAYRRHHSTETAMLKVLSDVLLAANNQKVTLLALLDLSAAFDCVDHDILLHRLQSIFGLGAKWLSGWDHFWQAEHNLSLIHIWRCRRRG